MTGCRNGLVARLRRYLEKLELEGIHYTAHKIELTYKDAVKDVPLAKKVDLLLLGIYLFYEKSSLNRSMLKHAHDICQQIQNPDDPAYHKDSFRKAKNYLLLLISADIAQYLHLLLDVVRCLGDLSELFQHGQTNISAIVNELQTAVDVLNKYLTWPGPSPRRIMESDTTMFQGEKLSGRSNTFKNVRYDMLTSLISSLNKRFIDMASTSLQNTWILNFKLWPAEYSGNKNFGDSAVQALAQALEKTLMEAEVNPTLAEDEWTVLKSYNYKSKTSLVSRLSWQQINQSYGERCASFLHLVDLQLSIPASSADIECGFSQVKLIKTDWRSRLTDDHLTDLMVVQLQTVCVGNFNPDKAIPRFLTTGARHVDGYTHTAGCSTVEDLDDNNELNEEHVQEMLVQVQ
ncbi:Zinc finger protein 862-like 12 [Homarus americanus]|uniref:Zinc finger protein 862-like 12 n=1 Tax=Homarus americanus TaxID=6706 RepID=A0A8J5T8Q1_HOMAM|nr:Zinc finger protein 862-like 12 [Homarus americanus]